jgi:hypothetical protein
MQTYIIALLNRKHYFAAISFWQIIGFHLFIGLPALTYLLSPIFLIAFLFSIFSIMDISYLPDYVVLHSKFVLIMGIVTPIFSALISMHSNKWTNMYLAVLTFPIYWVLHSYASYISVYELFCNTYYWNKTPHGLSKFIKNEKPYEKN